MADQPNEPVVRGTSGSPLVLTADTAAVLNEVKAMATRWFPDDVGNVNAAVNGAARYLSTDPSARVVTIEHLSEDIAEARGHAVEVLALARGTVAVAAADGWSENSLAQKLGVDRMTIRKWLGKRD